MAHEIDMSTGKAGIAFVGEVPWHGLGTRINPDSPIEVWRKEAGLDWEVKESPVIFNANNSLRVMEDRKVLLRSDNFAPLSVVSDGYKVVQPEQVLEFYRELVDAGGFKLNTAGALRGGRKIWALAEIGEEARIQGQDLMRGFLLLATSFDHTLATTAMFTSVRVVCNNTLQFAVQEAVKGKETITRPYLKINHNATFNPDQMKAELGLAEKSWDTFIKQTNTLAKRKVKDSEALEWLIKVFGKPDLDVTEQSDARIIKQVFQLYKGGIGSDLKSSKDTAWGLVNAATRFLDHERRTQSRDIRLDKAWFGIGARQKATAWDEALKLAA